MKANELINFPNLAKRDKYGLYPEGISTSFEAKVEEDIKEVMRTNGYSEEQVAEYAMRILKGNPQWVTLESKSEKEDKVNADKELQLEKSVKAELAKLNKKEQVKMLEQLGVDVKQVPNSEQDRIELIYKLGQKR